MVHRELSFLLKLNHSELCPLCQERLFQSCVQWKSLYHSSGASGWVQFAAGAALAPSLVPKGNEQDFGCRYTSSKESAEKLSASCRLSDTGKCYRNHPISSEIENKPKVTQFSSTNTSWDLWGVARGSFFPYQVLPPVYDHLH